MKTEALLFDLPDALYAQVPAEARGLNAIRSGCSSRLGSPALIATTISSVSGGIWNRVIS